MGVEPDNLKPQRDDGLLEGGQASSTPPPPSAYPRSRSDTDEMAELRRRLVNYRASRAAAPASFRPMFDALIATIEHRLSNGI